MATRKKISEAQAFAESDQQLASKEFQTLLDSLKQAADSGESTARHDEEFADGSRLVVEWVCGEDAPRIHPIDTKVVNEVGLPTL